MKLKRVSLQLFKNIVDEQVIDIEDDVTCLIGKNESGKTTILKALHRLYPANGTDTQFDITREYPTWRLARDRRTKSLDEICPVVATFELEQNDFDALSPWLPIQPPRTTTCVVARNYGNRLLVRLECALASVIQSAAHDAAIEADDVEKLISSDSAASATTLAKELAKNHRDGGEQARAKVLASFPTALAKYGYLTGDRLGAEAEAKITELLPKFFYFSTYDILPGECDLTELSDKKRNNQNLTPSDRTVISLLARAGEEPSNFLDENYASRKAELQAASADLTQHVFQYWTQNTDLDVVFDTDNVQIGHNPQGIPTYHRLLKIELRDGRHGNVETNFSTRSSGFQWFFSFFAAFGEYQDSPTPLIVLLDEPGTSLHGEAQKDFLRFIFEELGASKQTLYTTHSQFMLDPTRYEKMRAVHDRATRENPDLGVVIGDVNLSADKDTVLPIESALGYSISQHLFLGGGHHLAVEGSSDFIYLQRMTEHLNGNGRVGLDPRLAIISVGGDANMPAFVALLGRRLKVSALIDGDRTQAKLQRVKAAAKDNEVPESAIVVCSDVRHGVPSSADIEDLFHAEDYVRLYNLTFNANVTVADLPQTSEPILKRLEAVKGKFDHALPAHTLTDRRDEFFQGVKPETEDRFEQLFILLNATLTKP